MTPGTPKIPAITQFVKLMLMEKSKNPLMKLKISRMKKPSSALSSSLKMRRIGAVISLISITQKNSDTIVIRIEEIITILISFPYRDARQKTGKKYLCMTVK